MNSCIDTRHASSNWHHRALTFAASLLLCVAASNAGAQNKPGVGDLLNNIAPSRKNSAEPNQRKTDKLLIQKNADQAADEVPTEDPATLAMSFEVQGLMFEGHTVFSTQELMALLPQAFPGLYTLQQLEAKLSLFTEHYRQAGYPLVQVHIPEQVLQNGMVSVRITEPVWGQVLLKNQSQISDDALRLTAAGIQPGNLVRQADLERTLLLLADLPGAEVTSELQAGTQPDTTDLLMIALPAKSLTGASGIDNLGSKYTGRKRATASLIWSNPFRSADIFSVNFLSSGPLLNYQRMGYEWPIGHPGMHVGVSTAQMQYRLGEGAESLQAHGSLGQQTLWLNYPWLIENRRQFKTRIQFEYMDPADHQEASNLKTDRQLRILSVSANLENTDNFLANGLNQWNLEFAHGQTDFTNTVAAANDVATARTAGRFSKINLRGYRNQSINSVFSLSLSMDSQWAQKNLDATQKFSLGGLRSVRAYEAGALSADTGVFSSVELRMLLPQPDEIWNIQGQWYASVFWDKAVARVNQNPWTDKTNDVFFRGTGLALYWQGPNQWSATVSIGKSLGSVSPLLNSSDAIHKTAWLELAKAWR